MTTRLFQGFAYSFEEFEYTPYPPKFLGDSRPLCHRLVCCINRFCNGRYLWNFVNRLSFGCADGILPHSRFCRARISSMKRCDCQYNTDSLFDVYRSPNEYPVILKNHESYQELKTVARSMTLLQRRNSSIPSNAYDGEIVYGRQSSCLHRHG